MEGTARSTVATGRAGVEGVSVAEPRQRETKCSRCKMPSPGAEARETTSREFWATQIGAGAGRPRKRKRRRRHARCSKQAAALYSPSSAAARREGLTLRRCHGWAGKQSRRSSHRLAARRAARLAREWVGLVKTAASGERTHVEGRSRTKFRGQLISGCSEGTWTVSKTANGPGPLTTALACESI